MQTKQSQILLSKTYFPTTYLFLFTTKLIYHGKTFGTLFFKPTNLKVSKTQSNKGKHLQNVVNIKTSLLPRLKSGTLS